MPVGRTLATPDVRPAMKTVGVVLGGIGAFIALFPVAHLSTAIRLLLFALSLVAVGNANMPTKDSSFERDDASRLFWAVFQAVLGIVLGFLAVLPQSHTTMSLRVPALFTGLVLVGRIAAPTSKPVRKPVIEQNPFWKDPVLGPDGTPEDPDDSAEPVPPPPKGYEQVGPVVADRNRLAVPALAVVLAMWLGLGLLAQPEVSPLGAVAWLAMFRLFWIGWQRLTGEPGPSVDVPAGAAPERAGAKA